MAAITIRNIDDRLKARLRAWAAISGKSMGEEARDILRAARSPEVLESRDQGQRLRLGTAIAETDRP